MAFWLNLFSGGTWQEFLDAGATVTGFREGRWSALRKVKRGDQFLCYLTGVSRFVGILEVTGDPYRDDSPLWSVETFPCRVPVRPVVTLGPEYGIPVHDLKHGLSCFTENEGSRAWTGAFRGSPTQWSKEDGEVVLETLRFAECHPRKLPTDPRKLARKPRTVYGRDKKPVTIPEDEETVTKIDAEEAPTDHTEIQALLLRLGADMGYEVWVARNDRGRKFGGVTLGEYPRIKGSLPLQFDEATNRTIELIDVLWLKGNSIIAAFEVESTTSIYSGILRMSDLTAMQPNLNIPLYLVAPDDRRDKVFSEINRPTFSRLEPPLSNLCRYIPFSELKRKIDEFGPVLRYLKPEFLDELSEECSLQEDV